MESKPQISLQSVPDSPDFPQMEKDVLDFWEKIDAFHTQNKLSEGRPQYTFYDGPPFATGLPHYGHILAGTIKDVVTRYAVQRGFHVERRFGWDCHGLPVEYEIDKTLGISGKQDVLKMGIDNYNKECRNIVMRYSSDWRRIVTRLGRWIDFDNDYKTLGKLSESLDLSFMSSVWWVFKQMFDKGLVYQDWKVMPYSVGCGTVLSNFEANSNYQDTSDPSIIVNFPLVSDPDVRILAWTTTPWTLPTNFALAVNAGFVYVKFEIKSKPGTLYICAECRLQFTLKELNLDMEKIKIMDKVKGEDLQGLEYVPLFKYYEPLYKDKYPTWKVWGAGFVTEDAGTGVVHCAPFGEDDYKLYKKHNIIDTKRPPIPVDDNGVFKEPVSDFEGLFIKKADPLILEKLKKEGRLMSNSRIKHSYPFCWRSDKPLIYRPVQSWFIRVTQLKEDLLKNNLKAYWVPKTIHENRFHNWLKDSIDWCFSRNRYWGNPIPIWTDENYEELVCIGSVEELEELAGLEKGSVKDLHRENIDHIKIPSKKNPGSYLRRVEEVFDCWLESGSMPFAQLGYPRNISEEAFEKKFPADFIAEGVDQTRGWFYTLNVISTALRNQPPFKNLIVNGLVLAEDGKKMSKRLRNYPDPQLMIDQYGSDALRLYLVSSPAVHADSLRFSEKGLKATLREVVIPLYNSYRFLIQNIQRWQSNTGLIFTYKKAEVKDTNVMDHWILAATQKLISFFTSEMEKYNLCTVAPAVLDFLDDLNNWYIRFNRSRLKGAFGDEEAHRSLSTLFEVMLNTCVMLASFIPFLTETFYQNLRRVIDPESATQVDNESVHFLPFPKVDQKLMDSEIIETMARVKAVAELVRVVRDRNSLMLKTPVKRVLVANESKKALETVMGLKSYLMDELNLLEIETTEEEAKYVNYSIQPNYEALGKRLEAGFTQELRDAISALSEKEFEDIKASGSKVFNLSTGEVKVEANEMKRIKTLKDEFQKKKGGKGKGKAESMPEEAKQTTQWAAATDNTFVVLLDTSQSEEQKQMSVAREVVSKVNKLRKELKLNYEDKIEVFYEEAQEETEPPANTSKPFEELEKQFAVVDKAKEEKKQQKKGKKGEKKEIEETKKEETTKKEEVKKEEQKVPEEKPAPSLLKPISQTKVKRVDKNAPKLIDVVNEQAEAVTKQLKTAVLPITERPTHFKAHGSALLSVAGMKGCIRLTLCSKEWIANVETITELLGGNAVKAKSVAQLFQLFSKSFIKESLKRDGGVLKVKVDGEAVELKEGTHFLQGH